MKQIKKIARPLIGLKNTWFLWIFPVCAIAISGWLLMDYYRVKGTVIKVVFEDAAGIQVERTTVRYRGVPIGKVRNILISDDQKDVIAEILLQKDASFVAVEGSRFSLIVPKVSLQGISGLETVFEGTYIAVLPGKGPATTTFKAQNTSAQAPPTPPDETSPYRLRAQQAESLNVGDAVSYRGLKIGTITKMYLEGDSRYVRLQVSIENRYTKVIRQNSIFWRKMAFQAQLGLFHSEFKLNSMDTIMNGGLEVATPEPPGPLARFNQVFTLASNQPKNYENWSPGMTFKYQPPPSPSAKVNSIPVDQDFY